MIGCYGGKKNSTRWVSRGVRRRCLVSGEGGQRGERLEEGVVSCPHDHGCSCYGDGRGVLQTAEDVSVME